jgi:peroxiredoxin Q/BCP
MESMPAFLHGPPLPPGTAAPDFTLSDQNGNQVTLSKLLGQNVVLIFYPRDETPVCRRQLCEFRDQWELAKRKDTLVFGVNAGSSESHSGFHSNLNLPFPLLVDDDSKTARLYRAKGLLMTVRTVYLVDKHGRIAYAKRGKPNPEEVLASAV